jgi:glutamyl-tRNA reductase
MAERRAYVIGWDHHRTDVALRERLAVSGDEERSLLDDWRDVAGIDEAVVLSTCNRTECYLVGAMDPEDAIEHLAQRQGLEMTSLREHAYIHREDGCIRHLFRVISSLESMVLGEYQIVHQVKAAYRDAQHENTAGPGLNGLFQRALAIAKVVRNDTGIGRHKVSVASVAVDLARQIHGDLSDKRILVISAGEMAELAVMHLLEHGARRFSVINRTQDHATDLAAAVGDRAAVAVLRWRDLAEALADHDLVITSTGAPHAVLTVDLMQPLLERRREPMMILDLAVPRDAEPDLAELSNCYLFNVDHLDRIVADNRSLRGDEIQEAEALIEQAVHDYHRVSDDILKNLLGSLAKTVSEDIALEQERVRLRVGSVTTDAGGQAAELASEALHRLGNRLRHRLLTAAKVHGDESAARALLQAIIEADPRD